MAEDLLKIGIQSSSEKLKQNFPIDPKGDVQINFKQRVFKLQKAHLRLESGFFKRVLTANRPILQIAQDFDEEFFSNVLECFYGGSLTIKRKDLLKYYPIVRFLQIDCILKQLQSDIVNHIENYNFFQLFDLAYKYSDQIIFQKCLHQLQHQQFKQLKSDQTQVLKISEQLFKLVIKGHNRQQPSKRLLNAYQIYELICKYCYTNKISQEYKNQLKFQLIDKVNLTSVQYKHIFLEEVSGDSPRKMPARASSLAQNRSENNMQQFTVTHSANLTKKKLKLEMNTTFLKKINKQLLEQKLSLVTQLRSLNQITKSQSKKSQQIKQEFKKIRSKIGSDENQDMNIKKQIAKIQRDLKEIQLTMSRQDQKLKELRDSTKQLLDKYQSKSQKSIIKSNAEKESNREKERDKKNREKNESFSVCQQSFIWQKGPQIQQMYRMIDEKPLKSNTSISSQEKNKQKANKSYQNINAKVSSKSNSIINLNTKQNIFQNSALENRIQFDITPTIIRTAKQLQSLTQIISTQRFIKKRLKSLYRGSLTDYQEKKPNSMVSPNKVSNKKKQQLSNLPQAIKSELEYKQNVLYVFRTSFNKLVGGFVSVPLNFDIEGDTSDENAFLFSITQGKKFPLKKQYREEAITIQDGYLICFGTDLWISNNLFQLQNYCDWPKKYQSVKDKEFQDLDESKHWLVGDSVFQVLQFEIFEVEDAGSDMIL